MTKLKRKSTAVEGYRWFRLGDGPRVSGGSRNNGHLAVTATVYPLSGNCPSCDQPGNAHGVLWNYGVVVCPGDWIVTKSENSWAVYSPTELVKSYEEVVE